MPEPRCPWCEELISQHRHVGGSLDCLNAWVAQVILGCDVFRTDPLGFGCGCQSARGHHPAPHGWTDAHDGLADFSGEISAAWHVVRHVIGHGGSVVITMHGDLDNSEVVMLWHHRQRTQRTQWLMETSVADAMPLALCKAALWVYLGVEDRDA